MNPKSTPVLVFVFIFYFEFSGIISEPVCTYVYLRHYAVITNQVTKIEWFEQVLLARTFCVTRALCSHSRVKTEEPQ